MYCREIVGHFQRKLWTLYCACPTKEILGLSDLSVSEAHICLNNVPETWSLCTEWRGKALICVLSAMSITYLNSRSNFVTKRKEMLSNWFENKPGVQSCLSDSLTQTASGMRVISPFAPNYLPSPCSVWDFVSYLWLRLLSSSLTLDWTFSLLLYIPHFGDFFLCWVSSPHEDICAHFCLAEWCRLVSSDSTIRVCSVQLTFELF